MMGIAFCLLYVMSLRGVKGANDCPVAIPCSCDSTSKSINCDEPSLTIDHITFDEIPPLNDSTIDWKILNFSYNFIHAVHDNPFAKLQSVETIDLSFNKIGDVEIDGFKGIAADLKELDLQGNDIVKFPASALMAMTSLNRLDLGHNAIGTIDESAVVFIEAAIKNDPKMMINLKGNPFNCDCQLKGFVNLMKSNFKNIENPHDLRCAKPLNLAGRVLGALVDEELICYATQVPTTVKPDQIFPPACPAKHPCWCDFIGNIFCSKGDMLMSNVTFTEVPHIIDMSDFVWSFLHLSGHRITAVNTLALFPLKTRRLSLTNNLIETISEGAFFGTELVLEMLLLEGNRLSTIPDPVLELPFLNVLDLSLNDIFIIEKEKVEKLQKHLYPDIHGAVVKQEFFGKFGRNAFNCTCEMWYWSEFVKFNRENFQDLNLMFCVHGLTDQTVLARIDELTPANFPGCVTPTPPPEPTSGPHPDDPCPAEHPCWCTYNGDVICSANLLLPPDCPTTKCEPTPPLTDVPKWRFVTNNLGHSGVYLDSNRISTIPSKAFAAIKDGTSQVVRTIKIDLSNNTIQYIASDAFEGLEGDLEEVILTMNYLVEIPEALFPMHLLETLDLSFNHIQSYHEDNVKSMQDWRTRYIHNGTHLSPTDQRKSIQMRLGSNHLHCDVEMCALRYWVVGEPWDFIDETEIWCIAPVEWFGRPLHDVSLRELGCDTSVEIGKQLQNALDAKHTMAGLFAFAFLICLALGAYIFYLTRYKLKDIPFRSF